MASGNNRRKGGAARGPHACRRDAASSPAGVGFGILRLILDLRRYQRRWKIERLFAWFQNFRRLVVRYERFAENSLGMLHLACCVILLRGL